MVTQDKEEDRKDFVHLNAEIKYPVSNIQVGRRCRDTCGFQRKLFAYWGITHRLVRAGFKSVNARFLRLSDRQEAEAEFRFLQGNPSVESDCSGAGIVAVHRLCSYTKEGPVEEMAEGAPPWEKGEETEVTAK